jgi:hypothetical protein
LEGDRSFTGTGFPSWYAGPSREVSPIEEEVIEALWSDHNLSLAPDLHRRTIVTRGVPLGPPVGREFAVGGVRLRGWRSASRARTLVDVTGIRGDLHAQILEDGIIVRGDPIEERTEV